MSATPTPTRLQFPRMRPGFSTGPGSPASTAVQHGRSIPVVLWIHESNPSNPKPEAILNYDLFPYSSARPGDLIEIIPLDEYVASGRAHTDVGTGAHTAAAHGGAATGGGGGAVDGVESEAGVTDAGTSVRKTSKDESIFDKDRKRFLFVIREWSAEERAKQPNLQLSIASHIAALFKFTPRSTVRVRVVEKSLHEASHVEIKFRDQYIARSDMWRLAGSQLAGNCVYTGRKINFAGSIKAQVSGVWIRGQRVHSAYFSSRTRPIFRSESARFVLLVQMSREMWHFETEGNGEILFNKMINGFLPELFKRWRRINAHHLVSIVLFTRVMYKDGVPSGIVGEDGELQAVTKTDKNITYRDFFRVVVSNRASDDWTIILHQLKKEFTVFLKDVLVQTVFRDTKYSPPAPCPTGDRTDPTTPTKASYFAHHMEQDVSSSVEHVIAGSPSYAIDGNILEAINMACVQFSNDHVDRDLVRTGISIIVITPGTGHFEVSYDMLQMVTENLVANGIGIDLVCLAKPPLHSVPIFRYKNNGMLKPQQFAHEARSRSGTIESGVEMTPLSLREGRSMSGRTRGARHPSISLPDGSGTVIIDDDDPANAIEWLYAVPHWIDVSFWTTSSERQSRHHRQQAAIQNRVSAYSGVSKRTRKRRKGVFMARCKMYELQMMGVMENEVSSISIPFLCQSVLYAGIPSTMTAVRSRTASPGTVTAPVAVRGHHHESEHRSKEEKNALKFMEEYDELAFKPYHEVKRYLEDTTRALEDAKKKSVKEEERRLQMIAQDDPNLLSSSYRSDSSGKIQNNRAFGAYFDRTMKERRPSLDSPTEPVESASSSESKTLTGPGLPDSISSRPIKPPRLARQISFGFKGVLGGQKSAPLAGISGISTGVGTILTRGFMPPTVSAGTSLASTEPPPMVQITSPIEKVEKKTSPKMPEKQMPPPPQPQTRPPPTPTPRGRNRSASIVQIGNSWIAGPLGIRPFNTQDVVSKVEEGSDGDRKEHSPAGPRLTKVNTTGTTDGRPKDNVPVDMLKAAATSRLVMPRPDLTQAASQVSAPSTSLSPASALMPWLTILNPCNPKTAHMTAMNQFRRWQHVFPRQHKVASIKWKSLCSPAALPLTTEYFPTAEQLADEYQTSPYVISQNDDDDVEDISKIRKELVREMVSQRLARGFQIVVGTAVQEATSNRTSEPDIFAANYMANPGSSVWMSMGNNIHQLICDEEYNVEVKRYVRKPTPVKGSMGLPPIEYVAYVRTVMSDEYVPQTTLFKAQSVEYNWNYIDRFIGGYEEDFTEHMRYWRARFVLIPMEITGKRNIAGFQEELNEEEVRLEGIRKITQLFQRHRYVPPEERRYQRQKKASELEVLYKTYDPSIVVAQELETLPLVETPAAMARRSQLFVGPEIFERGTMKLQQLAQELQGYRGIRLQDRRWHLRLHTNCFIGSELINWIVNNFKDIDTREEALEYGKELMEQGLFQHVEKRHNFRDGNFFYQIRDDYINAEKPRPSSRGGGWFGTSRKPPPIADAYESPSSKDPPRTRSRSSSVAGDDGASSSDSGAQTPVAFHSSRLKVALSKVMRYNIDPNRHSYRPEVVNLHYDRLHNPENCYHIRIDWLNVTPKLIEDSLTTWAKTVHRFGLTLVEAPIDEASSISDINPFRSPSIVKLSLQPPALPSPKPQPADFVGPPYFSSLQQDTLLYHKAVLKRFNFVLDIEAAKNFPSDVEVTYSWGKPSYKYSQYIHRTGVVFAQILDNGDFLLLANRLFTQRVGGAEKFDPNLSDRMPSQSTQGRNIAGIYSTSAIGHAKFANPSLNSITVGSGIALSTPGSSFLTAEMVKEELVRFCNNESDLKTFYEEVTNKVMNPVVSQSGIASSINSAMMNSVHTTSGFMHREREREQPPLSPMLAPLGSIIGGSGGASTLSWAGLSSPTLAPTTTGRTVSSAMSARSSARDSGHTSGE